MPVTRKLVESVRSGIAENPYLSVSQLAEDLHASEADVVLALPLGMRVKVRLEDTEKLWREMETWPRVLVHFARGIEPGAPTGPGLPLGALSETPEGADAPAYATELPPVIRLRREGLGSVWFVWNSLLSEGSHSVRFFDRQGAHVLSVFLARDRTGRVHPVSKHAFDEARKRYGVTPVPRMRCAGCASCGCGRAQGRAS
jgi:putative heme iron utilization protein